MMESGSIQCATNVLSITVFFFLVLGVLYFSHRLIERKMGRRLGWFESAKIRLTREDRPFTVTFFAIWFVAIVALFTAAWTDGACAQSIHSHTPELAQN